MLTKDQHIAYWLEQAEEDFQVAEDLLKLNRYLHALFLCHLTIEKIAKAIWIRDNESNYPPKIHNINYLLNQSKFEISELWQPFTLELNKFQLEGRYQNYLDFISKKVGKEETSLIFNSTKDFKICLLNNMHSI